MDSFYTFPYSIYAVLDGRTPGVDDRVVLGNYAALESFADGIVLWAFKRVDHVYYNWLELAFHANHCSNLMIQRGSAYVDKLRAIEWDLYDPSGFLKSHFRNRFY